MAIFEKTIQNKKFDQLLWKLENEIPASSWSAELEAGSDFKEGDARCSVRVFERYSVMGGNRLSLTLTMFQNGDSPIRLSAITAGGKSQSGGNSSSANSASVSSFSFSITPSDSSRRAVSSGIR